MKGHELTYRQWKQRYAPQDSGEDYDLLAAFRAGIVPDANGHWPDLFKLPNHPTFSVESIYAVGANANRAGRWEGATFIPNHQSEGQESLTSDRARREEIRPDSDGGAICPCGHEFSFKVWILGAWDCPRCGRVFTVLNSGNPNYTPYQVEGKKV